MPVVGIQTDMLRERLGAGLSAALTPERLVRHLEHVGCDVEGMATLRRFHCERCSNITEMTETQDPPVACDRCGTDYRERPELLRAAGEVEVIRMELLAVRPDIFDPGGLARMLRGYLAGEPPALYRALPPRLRVEVDPGMDTPRCPRPAIACAVLRGIRLDDDLIKVLMKLQENLHWALGRDRKHASIGVYDLSTVDTSGPLRYRPVGPDEIRFVPLGYDLQDPAAAVTPRQVLAHHPKGTAYARLIADWPAWPLLEDARGGVLALIPVINSEHTRVRETTTDFFVDVTGSGERIVNKTLNVLVTSLLELAPGAVLEGVTIVRPGGETHLTPDLDPQVVRLDPARAASHLGLELSRADVVGLLRKMGHTVTDDGEPTLRVAVPPYRNDILHEVDLIEDVAIGYGYHEIAPRLDPSFTAGAALPVELWSDVARQAMTGLGFQEVMTLQLTNEEAAFDRMRVPRGQAHVVLDNPISADETMLRVSLLPGLLTTLAANTRRPLPQRIVEVGDVSFLADSETGAREVRHAAGVLTAHAAGFADLRPIVEALLAELDWGLEAVPSEVGTWLPGRGARIVALRGDERREVGEMGELHPEVLETFRLRHPAVGFEIDLAALA